MRLRTKIIILTSLMLIIASLLFGVATFRAQEKALLSGIDARLEVTARLAKEILPADYHDKISGLDSVSKEEYLRIVDRWNHLCEQTGLEYIWSLMLVDDKTVFTSGSSTSKDVRKGDHASFFETHSNPELYTAAFTTMKPQYQINDDKWGRIKVVLLPFKDVRGRPFLFGASMKTTEVEALLRNTVWQSLEISAGILFLGVFLSVLLAGTLVRPLEKLTGLAKGITNGNWGQVVEMSGSSEIRSLADSVNEMSRSIQEKITERQQADEAVRQSELRYRMLFSQANDGIFIITTDGKLVDVNESLARMHGYSVQEMRHMSLKDLDTPEIAQLIPERMRRVLAGEAMTFEVEHYHKDGHVFPLEVSVSLISTGGEFYVQCIHRDITERKRSEELLRESEQRFRELAELLPETIFETDIQGTLTFVNQSAFDRFGYTREDYTAGLKVLNMVKPDDHVRVMKNIQKIMNGENTGSNEFVMLKKDGSTFPAMIYSTVIIHDGKPVGLRGFVVDITKQKQGEEMSREIIGRLNLATVAAKAGVWDWNLQTNEMIWDDRMFELYGLTHEDFPGGIEAWERGLHPDDSSRAIEECQAALRGEHDFDTEFRVRRPDGTVIHIKADGLVVRDEGGKPLRLLGLNTDITERKQMEETLRASEQYAHNIINSSLDMIIATDHERLIVEFNRAATKVFGYDREEVIGKNVDMLYAVLDEGTLVSQIMLKEGVYAGEVTNKRKNGDQFTSYVSAAPLKDREGNVLGSVGVSRDITAEKLLVEERGRLLERLNRSEKMESLGTLAGGVAHDLNNVLGIIVGYAEMLLDGADKSSHDRKSLENIMNGGLKAAAIVEDLLTLARRGVQGRAVLNVNTIIADCQTSPEFIKLSSQHPSVNIITDLDTDLLNISGSAIHLGKSLYNLISNASEAMPKGGAITIKTTNQYLDKPIQGYDQIKAGDYVVLSVYDTGEGISEHDMKRIFEPFYTKKVMGRSGTGLGLAVVWGTVKDHNGYINVQSEEGKGSTFTLYFPVTREEVTTEAAAIPVEEYMGNGESILVVDDVKEQRDLAASLMKNMNYHVESVANGEEAAEYLKQHKVDLIILDMIMDPGMDGLDTYKQVIGISPKQKAIIVSGFSESDRVKEARKLGVGAYVRKPYIKEKLGLAVRKELDRK